MPFQGEQAIQLQLQARAAGISGTHPAFSHPTPARGSHLDTRRKDFNQAGAQDRPARPVMRGVAFERVPIFPPSPAGPAATCGCEVGSEGGSPRSSLDSGPPALQGAPPAAASPTLSARPPALTQEPDPEFAAVLPGLRTGCLTGSVLSTDTNQNDAVGATGRIHLAFEGEGRSKYTPENLQEARLFPKGRVQRAPSGKFCFCDCMHYRQYLQGVAWTGPVGGVADQPVPQITSGLGTLQTDGQWHEEDVSTGLHGNVNQVGCRREFTDTPGVTMGARAGVPVLLRYNFYLQVWDACQQTELWNEELALTLGGSTPPRSILWTWHTLPLSYDSVASAVSGAEAAQAQAQGEVSSDQEAAAEGT